MRAANGRPPLPRMSQIHEGLMKSTSDQWASYDQVDNAAGVLMAFFDGFVYTPGEESSCTEAIFTGFGAFINTIDTCKKIYLPYSWPNFQANL